MDISQDLLRTLQTAFYHKIKSDKQIETLNNQLNNKNYSYHEANSFAVRIGELLSETFSENIKSEELPNGKMYYNIAKKVIEPMMADNHSIVAENCKQTQSLLNKQANLGIVGQKPELNNDRIQGIVQRIADEDNFDDIKWILNEPIVNFSQSIVDDSIKSNADLHYKAGLSPKIVRTANAGCCEWCSKMVGSFDYPSGLPPDVFRRHGHCRCEVHYHPVDSKRKRDVWTKAWEDEQKKERLEKLRDIVNEPMSDLRRNCLKHNIEYNEIIKHKFKMNESDIIKAISGGDLTDGSCSSVALAYIGNKGGYNVKDFRGGKSCSVFAFKINVEKLTELHGVKSYIVEEFNDYKAVKKILKNVLPNKEYYLATGGHAAIIKMTDDGMKFLELQSPEIKGYVKNGFYNLDNTVLKRRFGCKKSHTLNRRKYKQKSYLIDADSLNESDEFHKILGFINTTMEQKGVDGYVK